MAGAGVFVAAWGVGVAADVGVAVATMAVVGVAVATGVFVGAVVGIGVLVMAAGVFVGAIVGLTLLPVQSSNETSSMYMAETPPLPSLNTLK